MRAPAAPRLDERRTADFSAELLERARAWIPNWGLDDDEQDFGRALLEIAARFNAEVAERLDGAGEKMRCGFLEWLAAPREAARPARMPVVFKLADAARSAVLASAPVQLQADAAGAAVMFETEKDVRLVPGRLEVVVGVDADGDAYFLPPPGLSDLQPIEPAPTEWRVRSFTSSGETKLQLDPELGLAVGMVVAAKGKQYTIRGVDNGFATIDRELENDLTETDRITKVATFAPFNGAHNEQEHALYLGDSELLNIDGTATIEIVGAQTLITGVTWQYWGKVAGQDEDAWRPLTPAPETEQKADAAVLKKETKGEIAQKEFNGRNSRWIRAYRKTVGTSEEPFSGEDLELRLNGTGCDGPQSCPKNFKEVPSAVAEGMTNTTPLVLDNMFFPLGKEPRQFDAFYLGCPEAFSKPKAEIQVCFKMAEASFAALSSLEITNQGHQLLAGVAADGCLHLLLFKPGKEVYRYRNLGPLQPPSPGAGGGTLGGPSVTLDQEPPYRVPIWASGGNIFVAVSAGSAVWLWKEDTPSNSGWSFQGNITDDKITDAASPVTGLVFLNDSHKGRLFALRESLLFERDLNEDEPLTWRLITLLDSGNNDVKLSRIAPIGIEGSNLGSGVLDTGLVGVGTVGTGTVANLYGFNGPGGIL